MEGSTSAALHQMKKWVLTWFFGGSDSECFNQFPFSFSWAHNLRSIASFHTVSRWTLPWKNRFYQSITVVASPFQPKQVEPTSHAKQIFKALRCFSAHMIICLSAHIGVRKICLSADMVPEKILTIDEISFFQGYMVSFGHLGVGGFLLYFCKTQWICWR